METRFYQAQGLDSERIAIELERMFITQGYQVQHFGDATHTIIQFKKGGEFAAMVGMQAALTLTLEQTHGGIMAVIGQQKWADKAAAGAVGMLVLWPLAFTAGAGAIRQVNLSNQVLSALDAAVGQQNTNVQIGQVPPHLLPPQVQQQLAPLSSSPPPYVLQPPPSISYEQQTPPPARRTQAPISVPCPSCSAPNAADDIYCARCGQSLASPKTQCPQCGAAIRPDAAFCTKCGASFAPKKQVVAEPTMRVEVSPKKQVVAEPTMRVEMSPKKQVAEPTVRIEMSPKTQFVLPDAAATSWGYLVLTNGMQMELTETRVTIGRMLPGSGDALPDINLYNVSQSDTVSRMHAIIQRTQDNLTVTDLNSTNLTRINELQLTPNVPVPLMDGDVCEFGHVKCTFRRI